MAKVIRVFRERYHDMKLYNIGDDYPDDDEMRVRYLVEQGFLSVEDGPKADPEDKPKRRKKGVSDDGDPDA
ncbi:hypothetical protein M4D58_03180 [Brevibacillus borstelensis]|uniref:hypothetical protein n=1 Tax=Brevibacillus borstelensis TaxID=45462 RepID=UPI00203C7AF1|nr:hypothetical protein [Brevibacillus borstelensis]MCM3589632.1 hypothetical protein [Brevibacillus borstelensis]